ncbi:dTDP-4-dehydrorhamnose reductase [Paenibacillus filicis]|uniref:dTDP-4-dehydrorhamnose reductase n=1 Tax=Paenibacillus gyeongsangnamensis TaxID=3388067 RepID=A0ABT4Q756_9BACL|nr:dTDP-4-dehydrorhamnose reductase [Paenibacillus filicis]MCZ8512545.1 dTDP-4-dehydrorhamnose reductase [Paenibacillus filicis]
MKILVTGAAGQLGHDVIKLFGENNELSVIGLDRQQLDVTSVEDCEAILNSVRPDVIIHCAAYTAVDQAEKEEDLAYSVNAFGARNLAVVAEKIGAKICYISTDYVFDGTKNVPYKEYDRKEPINVYGHSKHAGEELVSSLSSRYFIVRTSWVYGSHGHNFVKTMLKLALEKGQLKVVDDQFGSPTYTKDLAKFLLALIKTEQFGIYHATNTGSCSWFEFAKAIMEEKKLNVSVEPCSSKEYPRPAPRPAYSVMDHQAIRSNRLEDLRPWRDALKEFLCELGSL